MEGTIQHYELNLFYEMGLMTTNMRSFGASVTKFSVYSSWDPKDKMYSTS